jgi:serine/threonine protein kinase
VRPSRVIGRYVMYDEIASGGMATVHIGRLVGAAGFSRTVAIKHLHPHCSRDAEFVSMFLDEARLATRIQHPNVTVPLDVVVLEESEEIFLVMEYIHGDNFACLLRGARLLKTSVLPAISASITSGALHGLHAAHEAVDERGTPLNIVHRDVSPQNIMVGMDGVSRVLDFGIAKAVSRFQSTRQGQMKGKFAYMAPEQAGSGPVDRRADIFAAGIVLWEALTRKPLFHADDPGRVVANVLNAPIARPSFINSMVSPALDRAVMKALDRNVNTRFQTARDFAMAIEEAITVSSPRKVGEWVERMGGTDLARRAGTVAQIESSSFDAIVSSDPLQALRSKRAQRASDTDAKTTGSASDSEAVPTVCLSHTNQLSGTGRGDLLPTPPTGLSTYVPPVAHRTWPAVAVASLLVLALGAGLFGLSHRYRTKAAVKIGLGPLVPTTMGPRILPVTNAAKAVVAVPAFVLATTPDAAPPVPAIVASPAPAIPTPGAAATATEPTRLTATTERRSNPKTLATRPSSTSKAHKNCDPPYTIDPKGIRRVKAECL